MNKVTVLLDAGHGKETPGKRSPIWDDGTQLLEWEFNREIAYRVAKELNTQGVKCELIVTEDEDISLSERVIRVNSYAREEESFLVSIHANAGGGTGWEAFTSTGQTLSDEMAQLFYDVAEEMLTPLKFPIRADMVDGDSDKESRFYILRKTICPAVLTENLFMDTEKDCRFLMSEEGKTIIANLHIRSILRIINQFYK